MKAELVYHEKKYLSGDSVKEIKIWRLPEDADKRHGYKYSLVYIVEGVRVIGYDNAEGKGDHRHYADKESPYRFQGIEKLCKDFEVDVRKYTEGKK
ncbi:MAG: DUF6516 family protein [Dissulfurispiraceae bacterium]|jgi:hypothetical protein